MVGLILITLGPIAIFILAVYGQVVEEGMKSIGWALLFAAVGALLYFPIKAFIKPGIPDIDPYAAAAEAD